MGRVFGLSFDRMLEGFSWDENKNRINRRKHGISFERAQKAFFDYDRVIKQDINHSTAWENRYFCFGRIGGRVYSVWFTFIDDNYHLIGAKYTPRGRHVYESENKRKKGHRRGKG